MLDVSRVHYVAVTRLTMIDYLLNGISDVVRGGSVRMRNVERRRVSLLN